MYTKNKTQKQYIRFFAIRASNFLYEEDTDYGKLYAGKNVA
jgi:hypothetical protein